ncbi:MAG: hypothetical protein U0326_39765 [Polyangiales bacterium]
MAVVVSCVTVKGSDVKRVAPETASLAGGGAGGAGAVRLKTSCAGGAPGGGAAPNCDTSMKYVCPATASKVTRDCRPYASSLQPTARSAPRVPV